VVAQLLAMRNYMDLVLVDIVDGLLESKSLDLPEADRVLDYDTRIGGSNGYSGPHGSDVTAITSGLSRKSRESRDALT
jgi:malate dehydrogenase